MTKCVLRCGKAVAVGRVDGVEQRRGLGRLVRLEPAVHVQPHVGVPRLERGPLGLRFLHAAFPEVALAGGDEAFDRLGATSLADGDQGDGGHVALGGAGGASAPITASPTHRPPSPAVLAVTGTYWSE